MLLGRSLHRPVRRLVALLALGASLLAHAPDVAAKPPPRSDRLAQNWQQMDPDQRRRARENLQRYQRLPESSRKRMDRSYESWRQLDPSERERVQRNYQKYRQMTPDQRRDFENRYKQWKRGKEK